MSYISADIIDNKILVWKRDNTGERVLDRYPAPWYFYVQDSNGKFTGLDGNKLSRIDSSNQDEHMQRVNYCRNNHIKTYEASISPTIKLLSRLYYNCPTPNIHISFFDIEVDYNKDIGFSDTSNPYAPINAVTLYHTWKDEYVVLAVPPNSKPIDKEQFVADLNKIDKINGKLTLKFFKTERELLNEFLNQIEDTDLYCGWNSDTFDTPYIGKRLKNLYPNLYERLEFPGGKKPRERTFRPFRNSKVEVQTLDTSGRIKSDYLLLFKKYEQAERPSYKLESIADEILPEMPKLAYEGSLHDLYQNDFNFFIRYNIRDCEILGGLEEKLGYVALAIEMYKSSTGLYQNILGTIKLAEYSIINYCHHELDVKVPDSERYAEAVFNREESSSSEENSSIKGAYVLLPKKGMHEWIGSIDINSLYPSAIRSINISPETIIGQFEKTFEAFEAIKNQTNEELTFSYDDSKNAIDGLEDLSEEEIELIRLGASKKSETRTAIEWRKIFKTKKWSISRYGTVFTQEKNGVIPTILASWYATRKDYQRQKKDAEKNGMKDKASYFDRLQYVYKIKLNALYGALTNKFFLFYDLRMGESTTGTGREILQHQCREVNKVLGEDYNVQFPLYETTAEAKEKGYTEHVALDGPVFKNKFQAKAVIYGDTDSTYFKTFAQNEKEACLIADAVAAEVNKSYQKFMQEAFLCTPGFDSLIATGREVVANRGIFVGKKLYILRIVDKEGKKKVSLKTMGLQTKKTTLPKVVSKKLNRFIERLLEGEEWDSIATDIVKYKRQLETAPIMDIGLPKGIQGLEAYAQAYKEQGPTTRLPGHVAASVFYNICRERFNDTESMPIISGMKIKVFYLTQVYDGKFKSIALPTDIEQVPAWFIDHFEVDKEAHIERLVDKPLSTILGAINKTVPTNQSLYENELFVF